MMKIEKPPVPLIVPNPDDPRLTERVTGIDQTAESRTMLESANCPIVQIMEIGPNPIDMMIGFSHYNAACAAILHLLSQGCRRVGFLGASMDPRVQRRFQGYNATMKSAGLLDLTLIVTASQPSSVTLGRILLGDLLSKAPDIDAVFCANDLMGASELLSSWPSTRMSRCQA